MITTLTPLLEVIYQVGLWAGEDNWFSNRRDRLITLFDRLEISTVPQGLGQATDFHDEGSELSASPENHSEPGFEADDFQKLVDTW